MITLYQGGLGSGKTYDAVRRIIDNIKLGRRILTNIDGFDNPINNEVIKHQFEISDYDFEKNIIFLDDEQVTSFWEITKPNDFIVIDETQKYFGSRNWASKSNNAFLMWATEHRHNGQDLLLISPKIKMVDSAVRSMAEWIYSYRKINMLGDLIQKKYIRFAFYEGDDTPISKKVLTYDPLIFKCYQSFFTSEAKEIDIEKNINILKNPIFYALPVVICFFVYFLFNSSLFNGGVIAGQKSIHEINDTGETGLVQLPEKLTGEGPDALQVIEPPVFNDSYIGIINNLRIIKQEKGVTFEKI